jgi:hypothetical protein
MFALTIGQISHLCYVTIPDHPTKTRQIGIVHKNDTTIIPAPNQLPLFRLELVFTKYAISHGKNVYENGT